MISLITPIHRKISVEDPINIATFIRLPSDHSMLFGGERERENTKTFKVNLPRKITGTGVHW